MSRLRLHRPKPLPNSWHEGNAGNWRVQLEVPQHQVLVADSNGRWRWQPATQSFGIMRVNLYTGREWRIHRGSGPLSRAVEASGLCNQRFATRRETVQALEAWLAAEGILDG